MSVSVRKFKAIARGVERRPTHSFWLRRDDRVIRFGAVKLQAAGLLNSTKGRLGRLCRCWLEAYFLVSLMLIHPKVARQKYLFSRTSRRPSACAIDRRRLWASVLALPGPEQWAQRYCGLLPGRSVSR